MLFVQFDKTAIPRDLLTGLICKLRLDKSSDPQADNMGVKAPDSPRPCLAPASSRTQQKIMRGILEEVQVCHVTSAASALPASHAAASAVYVGFGASAAALSAHFLLHSPQAIREAASV